MQTACWSCESCTFQNAADSFQCGVCGTANPANAPAGAAAGAWKCTTCRDLLGMTTMVDPNRTICHVCDNPAVPQAPAPPAAAPPAGAAWQCTTCKDQLGMTTMNDANTTICRVCSQPRADIPDGWTCAVCFQVSPPHSPKCRGCEASSVRAFWEHLKPPHEMLVGIRDATSAHEMFDLLNQHSAQSTPESR